MGGVEHSVERNDPFIVKLQPNHEGGLFLERFFGNSEEAVLSSCSVEEGERAIILGSWDDNVPEKKSFLPSSQPSKHLPPFSCSLRRSKEGIFSLDLDRTPRDLRLSILSDAPYSNDEVVSKLQGFFASDKTDVLPKLAFLLPLTKGYIVANDDFSKKKKIQEICGPLNDRVLDELLSMVPYVSIDDMSSPAIRAKRFNSPDGIVLFFPDTYEEHSMGSYEDHLTVPLQPHRKSYDIGVYTEGGSPLRRLLAKFSVCFPKPEMTLFKYIEGVEPGTFHMTNCSSQIVYSWPAIAQGYRNGKTEESEESEKQPQEQSLDDIQKRLIIFLNSIPNFGNNSNTPSAQYDNNGFFCEFPSENGENKNERPS